MTRLTAFVIACVRCWTRMYTWRLPPAVRDARREEIESDLWESSHDPGVTRAEIPIQTLTRLTLGIADDLAWRFAQLTVTRHVTRRSVVAAAVLGLLLFATLSQLTTDVPHLPKPPAASLQVHRRVPDPPPPPNARPGWKPIFQYGRTSHSVATEGPPPVLIKEVQPIYPPVAVAGGLEGRVLVQARITEDGRVVDAEVEPSGILGQSAIDAVQRWEFAAAHGRPQRPALLTVRVTFGRSP